VNPSPVATRLTKLLGVLRVLTRRDGRVSDGALLTRLTVATYASGDSLVAWPSVETVANLRGLSTRQILRHYAQLERAGLMVPHGARSTGGSKNSMTRWRIVVPEACVASPDASVSGVTSEALTREEQGLTDQPPTPDVLAADAGHPDVTRSDDRSIDLNERQNAIHALADQIVRSSPRGTDRRELVQRLKARCVRDGIVPLENEISQALAHTEQRVRRTA